ncbi:MAG: RAMP superfamily CRISPR-associated protein, partial [Roseiflexaceae bacterium]
MTDMLVRSRQIVERIIITGKLKLLTPTSLSNGDADGLLDMPLARDAAEDVPLLTGSSIAGALRNYLRLREEGYRQQERHKGMAEQLFGGQRGNDEGSQSLLIVDDTRAQQVVAEIRDNVRIEPQTRTAQDKKKFDLELLPAGTEFVLRFELLIARENDRVALLQALALALTGFEQQEISLGARKRRGFGRCVVEEWAVQRYALTDNKGLLAWLSVDLSDNGTGLKIQPVETTQGRAAAALGVLLPATDQRRQFTIQAHFALASPLLIRSEEPIMVNTGTEYPDTTHLRSSRNG